MIESAEPKLKISIFDEERNSAAKEGMKMRVSKVYDSFIKDVGFPSFYKKSTCCLFWADLVTWLYGPLSAKLKGFGLSTHWRSQQTGVWQGYITHPLSILNTPTFLS